ncbi:MAG: hypothetical protein IPM42_11265 [Saprospiraceae bacterium]|nr:hypothetical protein [Saprospiraceae bacterium]
MSRYILEKYDENKLDTYLKNEYGSINNKFQIRFFRDYFSPEPIGLGAKTVVIENDYYSESFIDDYSAYYSFSRHKYSKTCKRVHFFSHLFSRESFNNFLRNYKLNTEKNIIHNSYLGYIVVKPIPNALIGATVLKPYPATNNELGKANLVRCYNSIREYKINLFGVAFKIKTLAFQEQDKNVSACATCAIWFALHYLSDRFKIPKLSPYFITKAAGNQYLGSGRMFPSESLDPIQIGRAITSFNLVYELRNKNQFKNDLSAVKAFIYSYNKLGLPVLLGLNIPGLGYHLITIVGFKINLNFPKLNIEDKKINYLTDFMDEFYAHDEHTGPFARVYFKNHTQFELTNYKDRIKERNLQKKMKRIDNSTFQVKINFSEDGEANVIEEYCFVEDIIIPLPQIIRIKFEDISKELSIINGFIEEVIEENIFWDVFLQESNLFKESVKFSLNYSSAEKLELLQKPLSKFVWVAKGLVSGVTIIESIFDASDMNSQFYCLYIALFDVNIKESLNQATNSKPIFENEWKMQQYSKLFLKASIN